MGARLKGHLKTMMVSVVNHNFSRDDGHGRQSNGCLSAVSLESSRK